MARGVYSTSNYFEYAGGIVTAAPLTFACWIYPTAFTVVQYLMSVSRNDGGAAPDGFMLFIPTNAILSAQTVNNGSAATATSTTFFKVFFAFGAFTGFSAFTATFFAAGFFVVDFAFVAIEINSPRSYRGSNSAFLRSNEGILPQTGLFFNGENLMFKIEIEMSKRMGKVLQNRDQFPFFSILLLFVSSPEVWPSLAPLYS